MEQLSGLTVVSYEGRLNFGLLACRELIPDLAELARGLAEGLEALVKATAAPAP